MKGHSKLQLKEKNNGREGGGREGRVGGREGPMRRPGLGRVGPATCVTMVPSVAGYPPNLEISQS